MQGVKLVKTLQVLAKAWLVSRVLKEALGAVTFLALLALTGYGLWAVVSEVRWVFGLW